MGAPTACDSAKSSPPKRKAAPPPPLPLPTREKLRAVVFDANAFSRGRLDIDELTFLADRLYETLGLDTWVPEPVAWEWAEHVAQDWDQVRLRRGQENKQIRKAGLESFDSPYADREAVIAAALSRLADVPFVEIVPLTPHNALAGLRDQVLQRRPAKRKNDTKTGASDSAWLRDVLDKAGDPSTLLIISDDRDIPAALEAWGKPPVLIRSRQQLLPTLFTVIIDDTMAPTVLVGYLCDQLPTPPWAGTFEVGPAPGLLSVVQHILTSASPMKGDLLSIDGVSIASVTEVVGIVNLTVAATSLATPSAPARPLFGHDPSMSPHTVTAVLMLLASVEAAVTYPDFAGDPRPEVVTVPDILLRAEVLFELEAGLVRKVRAVGDVAVFGHSDQVGSDGAAFEQLHEVFASIPGLDLPDDWTAGFDVEIEGHSVEVSIELTDESWSLEAYVDDDMIELAVWYDDESIERVGYDDFVRLYPPYQVRLGATHGDVGNPIWTLGGWLLEKLYGRDSTPPSNSTT